MKTAKKDRQAVDPRADAVLQNMPAETLDELWSLRHPVAEGDRVWKLAEIAAWLPERFGFSLSVQTVSNFYQWLELKRRMDGAAERAAQARLELARDPSISPEDLERVAQTVFTAETLESGDVKAYVAMARLGLARRSLDLDARRIAMLEAAARQAKEKLEALASNAKDKGGITPETLAQIEEAAGLL